MRRIVLSLMLTCLCPLLAQNTGSQENAPKFVLFSLKVLSENSIKANKILSDLSETEKRLNEKFKSKEDEIRKVQQQLQGSSLTDQAREDLQKKGRDLQIDYKKLQEDSQIEYGKVQQKVMNQLELQVRPIVEQVAKEQHINVVFYLDAMAAGPAGPAVYWTDDTWYKKFTIDVAKRLDAATAAPNTQKPKSTQPVKPGTTVPLAPPIQNP
jgi:Skp family chaperone for outer membrane proteins